MGDLISRQEVIDVLEKTFEKYKMAWSPNKEEDRGGFASAIPKAINDIPAAYNVDKVIEQLEEKKSEAENLYNRTFSGGYEHDYADGRVDAFSSAIDIVKTCKLRCDS